MLKSSGNQTPEELSDQWQDGKAKQGTIARLLKLRQENAALFNSNEAGELVPLVVNDVNGRKVTDIAAYARVKDDQAVVVMVPTDMRETLFDEQSVRLGLHSARLNDRLTIHLPETLRDKHFLDVLSGEKISGSDSLVVPHAFAALPGKVLSMTAGR